MSRGVPNAPARQAELPSGTKALTPSAENLLTWPEAQREIAFLYARLKELSAELAASRATRRDAAVVLGALPPGTGAALARLAGAIIRLGDGTKLDHVPRDTDAEGYVPGCGCSSRCTTPKPDVARD